MAEITWAHLANGDFADGADWKGGVVPGAYDDAILSSGGTAFTVTSSANETVNSIQTSTPTTLSVTGGTFTATNGTGTGENAGTISVSNGATLALGGTVDNVGSIVNVGVYKGDIDTVLSIASSASLTGGGTVTFVPNHSYTGSGIVGGTLTNVNNTISGGFGFDLTGLINESAGVINVTDFSFHGGLVSSIAADSITNAGLIECTGNYEIEFFATGGTINNAGGTILAGNGSTVELSSASHGTFDVLEGGTLETSGTGVITVRYVMLDGLGEAVTNLGDLAVDGGSGLALEGALSNSGTVSLGEVMYVNGSAAELTGGGQVTMDSGSITGFSAGATLTNVDNTISGSGSIGALGRTPVGFFLVNEASGVIDADGTAQLLIDAGAYSISNAGLIEDTGKGGLKLSSTTISNAGGTISVSSGSTLTMQGSVIEGGAFDSSGTALIRIEDGGNAIDVGPSTVDVTGELMIISGATLSADSDFDISGRLVNVGTATLSGAVTNTGLIESTGGSLTIDGAVTGTGVVLVDHGSMTFEASVSQNELTVKAGASLTVAGAVDVATKLISGGEATLDGSLINTGVIETDGGVLTVQGPVTGTGDAMIEGGTMTFGSAFSQKVVFDGTGELVLADSQGYAGTVWKFSTSGATSLDLQDIAFTGATVSYSGTAGQGVLTVTSGADVAHITFKGDYLGTTFSLSKDANGGTIVTDNAAVPSVAAITQAIAAFAPAQAASASVTHATEHRAAVMLTRPGTSAA